MSFPGTEHYREKAKRHLGISIKGVTSTALPVSIHPVDYSCDVNLICDHIDEQQKHIEQLKTHLYNYAEVIGKKQQEKVELRERVESLDSLLRTLVQDIDQWNKDIQEIIGCQPNYFWRTLEDARAALSPKQEGK